MTDRQGERADARVEDVRCLKIERPLWGDWCYLRDGHEGACRYCAACDGDPEAHGLHVCGKEPFA